VIRRGELDAGVPEHLAVVPDGHGQEVGHRVGVDERADPLLGPHPEPVHLVPVGGEDEVADPLVRGLEAVHVRQVVGVRNVQQRLERVGRDGLAVHLDVAPRAAVGVLAQLGAQSGGRGGEDARVRAERGVADGERDVRALLGLEQPERARGVARRDGERRRPREERTRRGAPEHAEPDLDHQDVVPHLYRGLEVSGVVAEPLRAGAAERVRDCVGLDAALGRVEALHMERELRAALRVGGPAAGQDEAHALRPVRVAVPVRVHLDVPAAAADAELAGPHALAGPEQALLPREVVDDELVGPGHHLRLRAAGRRWQWCRTRLRRRRREPAPVVPAAAALLVIRREHPRQHVKGRRFRRLGADDLQGDPDGEPVVVHALRDLQLPPPGEHGVPLAEPVVGRRQGRRGGGAVEDDFLAGLVRDLHRDGRVEAVERLGAALEEYGDEVRGGVVDARGVHLDAPRPGVEVERLRLEHLARRRPGRPRVPGHREDLHRGHRLDAARRRL
jgi:hypothetical protein